MISVLHFAHLINKFDFIDNIIRFCDPNSFRLHACTFTEHSNIQPPEYDSGIPHFVLGCRGRRDYPLALWRLAEILRQNRIDVLHTHHFDPAILGILAARATGTCGVVIGRHYSETLYQIDPAWKRRLYLAAESLCNRSADRIIVPSLMIRDILVGRQGADKNKVVQIPYGFDFSKYVTSGPDVAQRLRAEFGLDDRFVIGTFGRLHREKGQAFLLRAMKQLSERVPSCRLLVVGDGPDTTMLRGLAVELGVQNHVVFAGWRTDVVDLLTTVDVVVQPSLQEAFPQVMVEGMVMGKPVVISDVSGAQDVIGNNENGILVPAKDPNAICDAVARLACDPEFARTLGQKGKSYVMKNLDIRNVVRRFESCYRELCQTDG